MSERLLTIAALASQETEHLRACFKSLRTLIDSTGADTLIVLDAAARQETAALAHELADRVVVSRFVNFSVQRNRALDEAGGRWVFFIDPDERCTPELALEIPERLQNAECAAYRVPRRNIFFGREVRHTGWWPDYQVRLLERERSRYEPWRAVHEVPAVSGRIGTLRAPLVHYNYASWRQFFAKQRAYAMLEARALHGSRRRARLRSLVGQPLRELKRRLVDYEGYKDGLLGVALSVAMAWHTAETYLRLYKLQHAQHSERSLNDARDDYTVFPQIDRDETGA